MKILIVTPAPPRSRKGNRITAVRWSRLLRSLGHRVALATAFTDQRCDILVALHARRSHDSIRRFSLMYPGSPRVVALTGTDLYRDLPHNPEAVESLERATLLIVLQPHAHRALSKKRWKEKTTVIIQSAEPLQIKTTRTARYFDVCVLGHLRAEKDPFRTARAARRLPASSRIRVIHAGAPLDSNMARQARAEARRNPRYRWLGEVPRWKARRILSSSRLLVLSSKMEGGANVLSESIAASVPILASRIDGSTGILGATYPGLFPVGDTGALATLLHRAETSKPFYNRLSRHCRNLKEEVSPRRERGQWARLLSELTRMLDRPAAIS